MQALQINNDPWVDHGVEVLYRFAAFDPFERSTYFGCRPPLPPPPSPHYFPNARAHTHARARGRKQILCRKQPGFLPAAQRGPSYGGNTAWLTCCITAGLWIYPACHASKCRQCRDTPYAPQGYNVPVAAAGPQHQLRLKHRIDKPSSRTAVYVHAYCMGPDCAVADGAQ